MSLCFVFVVSGLLSPFLWMDIISDSNLVVIKLFNYIFDHFLFVFSFCIFPFYLDALMMKWTTPVPTAYILGGPEYFISKVGY